MTLFRNVVFIAALAGLLASVAMTAMQMFTTVPLILQAEVYENAAAAQEHDHAAAPADQAAGTEAAAPAHEHDAEAWEPSDGIERYTFTFLANIVSGIGFALILVAASEFAGGIGSWRAGPVLGSRRIHRVHAGARPRPAAGAPGHARRRPLPAAGLVDGDGGCHRRRPGADRVPPLAACSRPSALR